jgi:hypothetical protein
MLGQDHIDDEPLSHRRWLHHASVACVNRRANVCPASLLAALWCRTGPAQWPRGPTKIVHSQFLTGLRQAAKPRELGPVSNFNSFFNSENSLNSV